ncbi:hypothetical protein IDVR_12700 [Intrasporangium sp. DVR]
MVSVFAGFIFSSDPTIKQFGLALAVGILVDAFLVRMTLVPAVMSVLGEAAWWLPRRLGALLPNLDVEGDPLKRHLAEGSDRPRRHGALRTRVVRHPVPTPLVGNGHHPEGARPMAFQIPPSRKGLRENRFEFTLDGASLHDLPLLPYAPLVAVEALEEGRALSAVLTACDSDDARDVIRQLDADQFGAFVEAWEAASLDRGERAGSARPRAAAEPVH